RRGGRAARGGATARRVQAPARVPRRVLKRSQPGSAGGARPTWGRGYACRPGGNRMKIERAELRELTADLKFHFETSFGVEQDLRKVILVLYSGGLEGYGEVTAGNAPGYSYETTSTAWVALTEYLLPRVVGREFGTPE